jgi:hypothetical protein
MEEGRMTERTFIAELDKIAEPRLTDAGRAKAVLLVLRRDQGDLVDMLGLTDYIRARRGEEVLAERCTTCSTPMDAANTGRKSDGREFCRVCHRKYRREMFARQRAEGAA